MIRYRRFSPGFIILMMLVWCVACGNDTDTAVFNPAASEIVTVVVTATADGRGSALDPSEPPEISPGLQQTIRILREGGYVIYVRHTHTDRSREDTNTELGMCDSQRILSPRGQAEALQIRQGFAFLDIPVSRLISTQYCRTLETAVLAFGVPEVIDRQDLFNNLPELLATEPAAGSNVIIVAHIGTLEGTVGLPAAFDEGDALIYKPLGAGGFDYIGRISLDDWFTLAQQ